MLPLPADGHGDGMQQYWVGAEPYRHISVVEIAQRFKSWKVGQSNAQALATPFPKERSHKNALIKTPYALPGGFPPPVLSFLPAKGWLQWVSSRAKLCVCRCNDIVQFIA